MSKRVVGTTTQQLHFPKDLPTGPPLQRQGPGEAAEQQVVLHLCKILLLV
jgi:hypothetical protein